MRIFICGDSTAASYTKEKAPLTGWGQVLGEWLPEAEIHNHAMAGRSTKSFLAEGRLIGVEKEIRPGDLLLIQFAHNDNNDLVWRHTDPHTSFAANLMLFVDTARQHGAVPVLLTPIPVRNWENGVLQDWHGAYPEAIRRVAMQRGVPVLDITREGSRALQDMGEEATEALYMNVAPGSYPGYPDGSEDNVHTQREGAMLYARIAAEQLRAHGLV